MNFIKTQDLSTAERLRELGFVELSKEGKFFVFISDGREVFSAEEKQNMVYTNKLSF